MSETSLKDRMTQAQMIEDVIMDGLDLTPWEQNFIVKVSEYFDGGGFLSQKQLDTLEIIHKHKVK